MESARRASPPHAVDIERQQVVEQIIAGRDGGEYIANSARRRPRVPGSFRRGADNRGFAGFPHNAFLRAGAHFLLVLPFFAGVFFRAIFNCPAIRSTCRMWLVSCPANMRARCAMVSFPRSACMP